MAAVLEHPDRRLEATAARPSRGLGLPRRLLISGFILFHIVATLLWILPESALRTRLFALPQQYISRVGLWQSWGMFAPEPSNLNLYLTATVSYADGSQRSWEWPRPEQLDLFSRYQQERYRKFTEYGRLDAYRYLWPSMAQFAAQQLPASDPANPPVRVQLWRHWWFVPPPPPNGDISHAPPHLWNQYLFYDSPLPPQPPQTTTPPQPPQQLPGASQAQPPPAAAPQQPTQTTPPQQPTPATQAVPR